MLNALDVPGHEAYPPGYQELAEAAARELLGNWRQRLQKAADSSGANALFDPDHPIPDFGILDAGRIFNRHGHSGERFYQRDFPGQRGP